MFGINGEIEGCNRCEIRNKGIIVVVESCTSTLSQVTKKAEELAFGKG